MTPIAYRYTTLALVATLAIAAAPAPIAEASGFFGINPGGLIPHILVPGQQRHQPSYNPSGKHRKDKDGGDSNKDEAKDKENVKTHEAALASLGANKNLGVLSSVVIKSVNASAGSDDSSKLGKSTARTNKVDLPQTLSQFVTDIGTLLQSNQAGGDVSVVSVESSLDAIYNDPGPENLRQFEQIAGDTWSAEQFKVDILKVADQQLSKFAVGNNKGLVTMAQVEKLLRSSAHDVYVRTFEVSELIAMNKHIIDFDRALWENSGPEVPATASSPALDVASMQQPDPDAANDGDDPQDVPSPVATPSNNDAGKKTVAADTGPSQPSKMSHINSEMVRIAQLLVDDLSAEATRGMRDLSDAVRYRVMRATVDCFTRIAIRKTTTPVTPTPAVATTTTTVQGKPDATPASTPIDQPQPTAQQAEQAVADQKYIDLVNSFQKSIEKKDAKSDRDVDGECRVAADTLIGLTPTAVADQAVKAPPRDVKFLREPEPVRAVWSGTDWTSDQVATGRGN